MMFNAKVESGIKKERETYADAYKELDNALKEGRAGTNEFIEAFIRNYQLDKLVESMRQAADDTEKYR